LYFLSVGLSFLVARKREPARDTSETREVEGV